MPRAPLRPEAVHRLAGWRVDHVGRIRIQRPEMRLQTDGRGRDLRLRGAGRDGGGVIPRPRQLARQVGDVLRTGNRAALLRPGWHVLAVLLDDVVPGAAAD